MHWNLDDFNHMTGNNCADFEEVLGTLKGCYFWEISGFILELNMLKLMPVKRVHYSPNTVLGITSSTLPLVDGCFKKSADAESIKLEQWG